MSDVIRIYGRGSEWYAAVNGAVVGPWPLRPYAVAGAEVEVNRHRHRREWQEDITELAEHVRLNG